MFVFVVLFAFVFVALFCFGFLFCLCFFLEWGIWMGTLIRKNTGVSRGGGGGVGLWIIISAGLINWEVFWFGWGGGRFKVAICGCGKIKWVSIGIQLCWSVHKF